MGIKKIKNSRKSKPRIIRTQFKFGNIRKRKAKARNQRKIRRIFLGQENRRMIFSGIRKTAFAFRKIQKRKLNSNFREIEHILTRKIQ